jgi:hypothetical protein
MTDVLANDCDSKRSINIDINRLKKWYDLPYADICTPFFVGLGGPPISLYPNDIISSS